MTLKILLLAGTALAVFAQAPVNDDLLTRGRDRILAIISKLPRYVCTETVDRFTYRQINEALKHGTCDQIEADRRNGLTKLKLIQQDRLRLDVEVTDEGIEFFSWPGMRAASERVQDFVGEGQFGTGGFGPFLINIFSTQGVRFWPEGGAQVEGAKLRQFRYLVPLESSHYRVAAGDTTRVVPYEGRFWLDPATADLRRLSVRTGELSRSTYNCEGDTTVDFGPVRIGDRDSLLAQKSILHVVRRDAAELENVTAYASCHEFRGESELHFGDETPGPEPANGPTAATSLQASKAPASTKFPPGISLIVRFPAAIDAATAAAGDLISALAFHKDDKPKKRLLPEAGAPLQCRLTRMELDILHSALNVAINCEAVELEGKWIPFAAVASRIAPLLDTTKTRMDSNTQRSEGRRSPSAGVPISFPLHDSGIVAPAFSERWITVVPPAGSR